METEMVETLLLDTVPTLSSGSQCQSSESSADASDIVHAEDSNDAPAVVGTTTQEAPVTEDIASTVKTAEDLDAGDNAEIVDLKVAATAETTSIDICITVAANSSNNELDAACRTEENAAAPDSRKSEISETEVAEENDNTTENESEDERDLRTGSSLSNYSETGRESNEDKDNEGSDTGHMERREGGDGMERVESPQPQRKVDDDEDKNNPQYIPKRGTFYEHDYRTTEDAADEEKADAEKEKADGAADSKKKIWHDKREKWSHDKFKDDDQLPKSRDELIAIYGYDIRNEDGPPRARRRRRYGRGPNKYTRNWEDEDAYYKNNVKKPPQQRVGEQPQQEPLPAAQVNPRVTYKPTREVRNNPRDSVQSQETVPSPRGGQPRMTAGTGRIVRPNRDYSAADYKSFTKARNFNRGTTPEHQYRQQQQTPSSARFQPNRDNRDANVSQLDRAMDSLSIQQQQNSTDSNEQRAERKPASKRYSSIRQRSMPESTMTAVSVLAEARNVIPVPQQHFYGGNDYNNAQQQSPQQQVAPQTQMNVGMRPPPQLAIPPTNANALLRQQQFPPPPQFAIGPHAPPPQFLPPPPQPPTLNMNYQLPPQHYYQHQQAPPPPPFVPQHQVQVPAMAQSAEQLFQPQGGITYYSPEEQQTMQRHAPLVRPKVAIPILPPPPAPPNASNFTTSSDSIL